MLHEFIPVELTAMHKGWSQRIIIHGILQWYNSGKLSGLLIVPFIH
jgi:hypothetical protein